MTKQAAYHIPVMAEEAMAGLAIRPQGVYLDATLGGGGHFSMLAARLDSLGTLIGIDRDPQAIAWVQAHLPPSAARVIIAQARFSQFDVVLDGQAIPALDGILLDLGVSSRQIDDSGRGFSYLRDAPLDMRMDPGSGMSAAELLRASDTEELGRILATYGEVINAARMAKAIKRYASERPLETSADLKECLHREYGPSLKIKVLAKVFQALRIAVNAELDELRLCLDKTIRYLHHGGRLVVLTYHSLEDRIVKQFMRDKEGLCTCPRQAPVCTCQRSLMFKRINRKSIRAREAEIALNTRARSARLRIAERV
jgi:16S rRNA (cytosine1402-N4)-methyltransferase